MKIARRQRAGLRDRRRQRRRHRAERQQPDVRVLLVAAARSARPTSITQGSPARRRPTRSCSTRRRRASPATASVTRYRSSSSPARRRSSTFVGVFRFGDSDSTAGATRVAFTPTHRAARRRPRRRVGLDLRRREARRLAARGRGQRPQGGRGHERRARSTRCSRGKAARRRAGQQREGSTSAFLNTFLLVFAFIALFVGSFIIYNTFSIIVAQRSRELALLRALGASGKQVTRFGRGGGVRRRAALVGARARPRCARRHRAAEPAGRVRVRAARREAPVILARTVIVALVAGTVVTFVSALSPARRAARVPPVAAMRDSAVDRHEWRASLPRRWSARGHRHHPRRTRPVRRRELRRRTGWRGRRGRRRGVPGVRRRRDAEPVGRRVRCRGSSAGCRRGCAACRECSPARTRCATPAAPPPPRRP